MTQDICAGGINKLGYFYWGGGVKLFIGYTSDPRWTRRYWNATDRSRGRYHLLWIGEQLLENDDDRKRNDFGLSSEIVGTLRPYTSGDFKKDDVQLLQKFISNK